MKFLETGDSILNFSLVCFIQKLEEPARIKYYLDGNSYLESKFESKEDRDSEYERIKTRILWPESYGLCP